MEEQRECRTRGVDSREMTPAYARRLSRPRKEKSTFRVDILYASCWQVDRRHATSTFRHFADARAISRTGHCATAFPLSLCPLLLSAPVSPRSHLRDLVAFPALSLPFTLSHTPTVTFASPHPHDYLTICTLPSTLSLTQSHCPLLRHTSKRHSSRNITTRPSKKQRPLSPVDDYEGDFELTQRSQLSQLSATPSALSPSSSTRPSTSSPLDTLPWESITPFQPTQLFSSSLPIFRKSDVRQYESVEEKSEEELARYTFTEVLDYFLRLPTNASKRRSLFTDQQYIDLLHQCMNSLSVATQMVGRDKAEERWLWGQLKLGTYKHVRMSYQVSDDRTGNESQCSGS
jgi:hypothetical protein